MVYGYAFIPPFVDDTVFQMLMWASPATPTPRDNVYHLSVPVYSDHGLWVAFQPAPQ